MELLQPKSYCTSGIPFGGCSTATLHPIFEETTSVGAVPDSLIGGWSVDGLRRSIVNKIGNSTHSIVDWISSLFLVNWYFWTWFVSIYSNSVSDLNRQIVDTICHYIFNLLYDLYVAQSLHQLFLHFCIEWHHLPPALQVALALRSLAIGSRGSGAKRPWRKKKTLWTKTWRHLLKETKLPHFFWYCRCFLLVLYKCFFQKVEIRDCKDCNEEISSTQSSWIPVWSFW